MQFIELSYESKTNIGFETRTKSIRLDQIVSFESHFEDANKTSVRFLDNPNRVGSPVGFNDLKVNETYSSFRNRYNSAPNNSRVIAMQDSTTTQQL